MNKLSYTGKLNKGGLACQKIYRQALENTKEKGGWGMNF